MVSKCYVVHGITENTVIGETVLLVTFDRQYAENQGAEWLLERERKGVVASLIINEVVVNTVYEVA